MTSKESALGEDFWFCVREGIAYFRRLNLAPAVMEIPWRFALHHTFLIGSNVAGLKIVLSADEKNQFKVCLS